MSDYMSRNNVIDVLKETGIIQDNDLGHLVVDEINRIPTVDETEIIRKAFERVVKRLEELKNDCDCYGHLKKKGLVDWAIEIVKEECKISE